MTPKTGWNFHELYLWHVTGPAAGVEPAGLTVEPGLHVENAETKRRFRNLMEVSGLADTVARIDSVAAAEEDLTRFHTRDYVRSVKAKSDAGGGDTGHYAPFGKGSYEIAALAAGGTAALMDAVLAGRVRNGYALVRPPGHHAEREHGMGFCLFGNIPVAILKNRITHRLGRVAVVDWDVHHGNGTQQAFYETDDVLTISLHQDGLYPLDSGFVSERGAGKGEGYNINVPLPAGSGEGAYRAAFEQVVIPALRAYRPELIVVASGFDASAADPLGRMMLHSGSYRALTAMLMEQADDLCGGRLVMSHEGGYSAYYVPYCGLAVMEQMSGVSTGLADPYFAEFSGYPGQELLPHQQAAVEKARGLVAGVR